MTTPSKNGLSVGGGTYPADTTRNMGVIGLTNTTGTLTPAQTIVSGRNQLYKTTTGINTFKPNVDNYVLDINGPVRIDNNDVNDVTGPVGFELYSMSVNSNNPNWVVSIGSSYQIKSDVPYNPNGYLGENLIFSSDAGYTWNTKEISITGGYKGNVFTSVYTYSNSSYNNNTPLYFITGSFNTIIVTSSTDTAWTNIPLSNSPQGGLSYNNICVKNKETNSGNVIAYFSIDISSTFVWFEYVNP
jgi:hypothetical protein